MRLIGLWWLAMSIAIGYIAIKEDRLLKKITAGYKPNARDGDKDGLVQEGTRWERKIK